VTVPAHLRRQTLNYPTREAPGTVVIDTSNTYLYFVLGGGRAVRYGIGVGRDGFTWSGTRSIDRKQEWPDWHPPAEMIARQPYLPRFMAGGPGNPLGARAMYLGGTLFRIHGTNQPGSIGQRVSSGCIRMLNEDAIDLYNRAPIGTKVVVLPDTHRRAPANVASAPEPQPAPSTVTITDDPPRPMASVPTYPPFFFFGSASRLY
jgi:lipoprotein-anchoring transpeptidase ErfK/SrfK